MNVSLFLILTQPSRGEGKGEGGVKDGLDVTKNKFLFDKEDETDYVKTEPSRKTRGREGLRPMRIL
jgi:hypothetical protein